MNVLICDDVKHETDKLARLLRDLGVEPVVFNSPGGVLDYVHTGAAVDVCFLDIVMPEMNGIELAGQLRADGYAGEIVFLSTSNEYAHQSYNVKAFHYLLKPPTPESVKNILGRLDNARRKNDMAGIAVNVSSVARSILFRDISHIEVINHCVHFRLTDGEEIETYTTFGEAAAQLLRDKRFIQCHRSYVVNMNDVAAASEREFIMRGGARIPISRGYSDVKDKFLLWMFGGGR